MLTGSQANTGATMHAARGLAAQLRSASPDERARRRCDAEWRAMDEAHRRLQAMPESANLAELVEAFDAWHNAARRFLMAAGRVR